MVIYDLVCQAGHEFEGWFKNADEFASQQESGVLTCPFCGTGTVIKKIAAPKVTKKSNSIDPKTLQSVTGSIGESSTKEYARLQTMLSEVHDYVDANFVDVGNRFADEALSIHRGEKEKTNIRGTASQKELKSLADEGVTALSLPPKPAAKKDLN